MADLEQSAQGSAAPTSLNTPTGKRFLDMSFPEKLKFLGKVIVMLCTGGFVFPKVFVE
jgi:hypothetical protein